MWSEKLELFSSLQTVFLVIGIIGTYIPVHSIYNNRVQILEAFDVDQPFTDFAESD